MRMWMVDPEFLCRKHLLGEHCELHMASAWILRGKYVDGWADTNCLEPRSIGIRHEVLAAEMLRRGYKHTSPLRQPRILPQQRPEAHVDQASASKELAKRCPECRKLLKKKLKINARKARKLSIMILAA